jgi:hypothetical protein
MNRSLPPPIPLSITVASIPQTLPVQSSLIASIAYDHARAILQLEFRSGAVYQYFGVPSESYQQLLQAESYGAYFNRHIRNFFTHALLPAQSPSISMPE